MDTIKETETSQDVFSLRELFNYINQDLNDLGQPEFTEDTYKTFVEPYELLKKYPPGLLGVFIDKDKNEKYIQFDDFSKVYYDLFEMYYTSLVTYILTYKSKESTFDSTVKTLHTKIMLLFKLLQEITEDTAIKILNLKNVSTNESILHAILRHREFYGRTSLYEVDEYEQRPTYTFKDYGDEMLTVLSSINGVKDIVSRTNTHKSPLFHLYVTFEPTPDGIKKFVELGASVDSINSSYDTPLHVCLEDGSTSYHAVRTLIELGSSITCQNIDYEIPLHVALRNYRITNARIWDLLTDESCIRMADKRGVAGIHIAHDRNLKVAKGYLLSKFPKLGTLKNRKGETIPSSIPQPTDSSELTLIDYYPVNHFFNEEYNRMIGYIQHNTPEFDLNSKLLDPYREGKKYFFMRLIESRYADVREPKALSDQYESLKQYRGGWGKNDTMRQNIIRSLGDVFKGHDVEIEWIKSVVQKTLSGQDIFVLKCNEIPKAFLERRGTWRPNGIYHKYQMKTKDGWIISSYNMVVCLHTDAIYVDPYDDDNFIDYSIISKQKDPARNPNETDQQYTARSKQHLSHLIYNNTANVPKSSTQNPKSRHYKPPSSGNSSMLATVLSGLIGFQGGSKRVGQRTSTKNTKKRKFVRK